MIESSPLWLTVVGVLAAAIFRLTDFALKLAFDKWGSVQARRAISDGFGATDRAKLDLVAQAVTVTDPSTGAPAMRCRADAQAMQTLASTQQKTVDVLDKLTGRLEHMHDDVRLVKDRTKGAAS